MPLRNVYAQEETAADETNDQHGLELLHALGSEARRLELLNNIADEIRPQVFRDVRVKAPSVWIDQRGSQTTGSQTEVSE